MKELDLDKPKRNYNNMLIISIEVLFLTILTVFNELEELEISEINGIKITNQIKAIYRTLLDLPLLTQHTILKDTLLKILKDIQLKANLTLLRLELIHPWKQLSEDKKELPISQTKILK
jgi:hypothetical protein